MIKTMMPDGNVYVRYGEMREQALMYANMHSEPDTLVVERAKAYLAFLNGDDKQQGGGDPLLHAGN